MKVTYGKFGAVRWIISHFPMCTTRQVLSDSRDIGQALLGYTFMCFPRQQFLKLVDPFLGDGTRKIVTPLHRTTIFISYDFQTFINN